MQVARAQIVFVKTTSAIEPRAVRIGLTDFDYAEVLSGVQDGEQVVLLGVAQAEASREQAQDQMRRRVGNGVPGSAGGGASRAGARKS